MDTLNRTITFNYDVNANLSSISQSWNGTQHIWASFGWSTTTIHPNFTGVALSGVKDYQSISVVQYIYLADNSYYKFTYDSGITTKGLVTTFERWAVDGLHKGSVVYDYATAAGDIPRLTAAHDSADYWNGFNGVPYDISTQFSAATDNSWCRMTTPDGAVYKVFYPTSGWQKGLGLASSMQVFANASDETNNLPQKTTVTTWTQDNTSVNYLTNPRLTETNITDAANNHRRATYSYTAPIALPEVVLWQTVGAASIVIGMLIAFAIALIDQIFGTVPFDYGNSVSWKLLWALLAAFSFVALINLFYGAFIQISAQQYSPH